MIQAVKAQYTVSKHNKSEGLIPTVTSVSSAQAMATAEQIKTLIRSHFSEEPGRFFKVDTHPS